MPKFAPVPILAVHQHGQLRTDVTFDQTLVLDPSDDGLGWAMIHDGETFINPTMTIMAGGVVMLEDWVSFAPATGINRIAYTNPAGVVRNLAGTPAEPFANFPVD